MEVRESQPPMHELADHVEWARPPDKTIFVANTKEAITTDALKQCVQPWLQSVELADDNWEIDGPSPGQRYAIRIHGGEGLAARRVIKAFRGLKDDRGTWRRFEAPTPTNIRAPVYVGLDKSQQTIRREIRTKKLLELVKAEVPPGRWNANRHAGVVSNGSTPVIRVLVGDAPDEQTVVEWNYRAVADAGMDHSRLREQFNALYGPGGKIQWSTEQPHGPLEGRD